MSTKFYIAPYKPSDWENQGSDIKINSDHLQDAINTRWIAATFKDKNLDRFYELEWRLPPENNSFAGLWGGLRKDMRTVEFDTGPKRSFIDFILWYRSYISSQQVLYLFNSSDLKSLELKTEVTEEDIVKFTGIVS